MSEPSPAAAQVSAMKIDQAMQMRMSVEQAPKRVTEMPRRDLEQRVSDREGDAHHTDLRRGDAEVGLDRVERE